MTSLQKLIIFGLPPCPHIKRTSKRNRHARKTCPLSCPESIKTPSDPHHSQQRGSQSTSIHLLIVRLLSIIAHLAARLGLSRDANEQFQARGFVEKSPAAAVQRCTFQLYTLRAAAIYENVWFTMTSGSPRPALKTRSPRKGGIAKGSSFYSEDEWWVFLAGSVSHFFLLHWLSDSGDLVFSAFFYLSAG